MKAGGHLPEDQAEITYSDFFVEALEGLSPGEKEALVAATLRLCFSPGGEHSLSLRGKDRSLVGWNTIRVGANGDQRVVYHVDESHASIFVLCLAPRRDSEVYDIATGLVQSGALTADEATDLWDALGLLDILAEQLGLDGWDYRPTPAPAGLQRAAVSAGLLDASDARLMSTDEINAAMAGGWGAQGADPAQALAKALERARGGIGFDSATWVMEQRGLDRCGALMKRAAKPCVRRKGHPGVHRSAP